MRLKGCRHQTVQWCFHLFHNRAAQNQKKKKVQQSDVYNRYLSQICWWRKLPALLGHRDINVIAKRNSTKASQVTKKMLHQFQRKQNEHNKSECLIPVSVTKYQTVTFIMNGSDYLPLLTVASLAPQSEHKWLNNNLIKTHAKQSYKNFPSALMSNFQKQWEEVWFS